MVIYLIEIIKIYFYELFGREEVKFIVENVKEKYSVVVEEFILDLLMIGEF